MYFPPIKLIEETMLDINTAVSGESIEEKMYRAANENTPIDQQAEILYTEKKDGVLPETDIRTDRFDVALEAMDKVTATRRAMREKAMNPEAEKGKEGNDNFGEPEPTQVN